MTAKKTNEIAISITCIISDNWLFGFTQRNQARMLKEKTKTKNFRIYAQNVGTKARIQDS